MTVKDLIAALKTHDANSVVEVQIGKRYFPVLEALLSMVWRTPSFLASRIVLRVEK